MMKVIVAGFPKTGTKSMNAALTKLGYKVYDYLDNFMFLHDQWKKVLEGKGSTKDFKEMYEDVDAVVDSPAFLYWYEIHQAFPDAKIILTTREEESWYKSFENQVQGTNSYYGTLYETFSFKFVPIMRSFRLHALRYANEIGIIWTKRGIFFGNATNKMFALHKIRRHNANVLQNAPKDKLLIYNVKEGWNPLCEFLGKKIPDTPFPKKNVGGSHMSQHIQAHQFGKQKTLQTYVSVIVLLLTGITVYYFLSQYLAWLGIPTFLCGLVLLFLLM